MKRVFQFTTALLITSLTFSACQQTLSEPQKEAIEKELLEFTNDIMDRFNNRDTATVYTYYTDDFTLLSRGLNKITDQDSWEKMKASAKQYIATRAKTIYEIQNPWVEVYSRNTANICYNYTRTVSFENGVSHTSRSASTWTVVKREGEWKIKHAHLSDGKEAYRAVEGEKVWVLLNKVAADKREVFEKFMHEAFFEKVLEEEELYRLVKNNTRILHPSIANEDGTYTYVFIMDPLIPGYDYGIMHHLIKVYGEEEAQEKIKMFTESLIEPQTLIVLEQTVY
ncbi:MAG: nuclear transport factor 2 family protein [Bacteroidota bacterium]